MKTQEHWLDVLNQKKAIWLYNGKPSASHALLTSGNHSNGFVNSGIIAEDPRLLDEACAVLVEKLRQKRLDIGEADRVVGPAMGAITLANLIALNIAKKRHRTCFTSYTEKVVVGENKIMRFARSQPRSGEMVLVTEDVLTTGSSVKSVIQAIEGLSDPTIGILPYILVLVNRSGLAEIDGREIIALIDRPMIIWSPEDCPLCKGGSQAIRPKENWVELSAL